jgi:hypothetical protein
MNKLITSGLLFIVLTFGFSGLTESNSIKAQAKSEISECRYGQCYATAQSTGYRCRHCVSNNGDLYCWQHR